MRTLTLVFWLAGITVIATLIYFVDVAKLVRAVTLIGWGFFPVLLVRAVTLFVDAHSWRCLLRHADRPSRRLAAYQRWIGESVSAMFPFAAIGGELARTRVIIVSGMSSPLAFASIIMDGVVALVSQFLFLSLGVALFARTATTTQTDSLNLSILIAIIALLTALIATTLLIRGGVLGRLAQIMKKEIANERIIWLAGAMDSVDQRISEIAGNATAFGQSVAWRLLGWLVGAAEIWLIMNFLDHPISIQDALILDAVTSAVRTAFFFVPGGLAVQEGAMILVGATLGVNGDAILLAAIIKRAREIFVSLPGLLAWELIESKSMSRSEIGTERIGSAG